MLASFSEMLHHRTSTKKALSCLCSPEDQASSSGCTSAFNMHSTAFHSVQVFGDACDEQQARKMAQFADIIFLGVKPQYLAPVLAALAPHITPRHTVVSIAAGWTLSQLEACLPAGSAVMRIMPNTPILIGQGASAYVMGAHASAEDRQAVHRLLQDTGVAIEVPESSIDAVVGVAGSAPAYMFQVSFQSAHCDPEGIAARKLCCIGKKIVQSMLQKNCYAMCDCNTHNVGFFLPLFAL
jgi:pyrroline-5-carboxylate reductase